MTVQKNNHSFLGKLVRAGLWEKEARLTPYQRIVWLEAYRFASEQSF